MPDNLLNPSNGLSKSLLDQITAEDGDVFSGNKYLHGDGTIHEGSLTLSGTATAADVLEGKTFYSGSKTLQTGSLSNIGRSIDVLDSYVSPYEAAISYSRTISDNRYKSFAFLFYSDDLCGRTSANISSGSLTKRNCQYFNHGSNNRYEWGCELYIINNPTIPFTFSATTNGSWSWGHGFTFLGIR